MRTVHKFLFDTSFDQVRPPAPKAAPAPVSPEPGYTEADLAAAREEAFAAGKEAGAKEAQAGIEQAAAKALEGVGRSLSELLAAQAEAGETFVRTALETAAAIVRKLHPEFARRHGLMEVEAVLRHCLENLRDEPRLVVRVEDGLLDALNARIDPLTRSLGFGGRIVLLADATIAPGDCRVEWADGGIERNGAALCAEVEAAVDRALADLLPGKPEPQEASPSTGPGTAPETTADRRSEEP